jgi:hypothetical protein
LHNSTGGISENLEAKSGIWVSKTDRVAKATFLLALLISSGYKSAYINPKN